MNTNQGNSGRRASLNHFPEFRFCARALCALILEALSITSVQAQCPPITLSPSSLPDGVVNTSYSQQFSAKGDGSSYAFSVVRGSVPNGLSLSASGTLSGTPEKPGMFTFVVQAKIGSCTGSITNTLTVNCPTITLGPSSLPDGVVNTDYSPQQITANGGVPPYSFTALNINGVTLSSSGLFSGTPTAAGTTSFTVTVTDSNGCPGSAAYTLTVNCAPITLGPPSLPSGQTGVSYNQMITASGPSATLFYGTTSAGGLVAGGTVFTVTSGGVLNTIASFDGIIGETPLAGLVQGTDGNFYGTTSSDIIDGYGSVFKMTPGGVLIETAAFGGTNGANPQAGLVQGTDGNFYGTTSGGANGLGTVFKTTPDLVLSTMLSFTGNGGADPGANPQAGLVQGTDGNFYGTTSGGATNGDGTVFMMTSEGVLTTLVSFTGNSGANPGANPQAGLVQGTDGNFYGTTVNGGANGEGTVFQMTPRGG